MKRLSEVACVVSAGLVLAATLVPPSQSFAQGGAEETPEEVRARKINDRFLSLLKKKPRLGTALDRVYGFHVERGSLEEFTKSLNEGIAKDPKDGTNWMLLGMLELQRGRDSESAKAFREAEKLRKDDPLASYYLGRALILIGETDQAAAALERAIERKPQRTDALEIFQTLGRIYQRSSQSEKALKVWSRMEDAFPDDARVQEQIATILADESDYEAALKRFNTLASKTTDRYRRVQYALEAGALLIRLGKSKDALAGFEKQLDQLKPNSWLFQDVRRRIEDVFLRTDDYAGLVEYYEKWLKKNVDDVDAMTRIGEALAFQGRLPEAREWYRKAIEKAPSNTRIRRALIDQFVREEKYADAVKEYEALDKIQPNNPDNIEQWGLMILSDAKVPEAKRKQQAGAVWRRLIDDKPDDPVIASQVADLFRNASIEDEAIKLYKKAIKLAPRNPQYREYLGEYYHVLKRSEDAIKTWDAIAAGKLRTTQNLVRLAEVFSGFGYDKQGLAAMTDACKMDPEFSDRIRFAQMLRKAEQVDESLEQLALAAKIAESPEENQQVLTERIQSYVAGKQLPEQIKTLRDELDADKDSTDERWLTLSLYYEANNQMPDAAKAAEKAIKLNETSVPAWTAIARLYERTGRIGDATDANRKLASLDRRYRTEYLKQIAGLEMRLGRLDEAMQAGRDLIAAAPGNPEHYQFFANLCFQMGRNEPGFDALRRSVRVNPSDTSSLRALASALSNQFRTDEAIELYWRAFDKAVDIDEQTSLVGTLSELYLRTNHFDRLVTRLENLGKELNAERDMKICLATAYNSAGDLGMARDTLEDLLTEDSRDTQLLTELCTLAEKEGDIEASAEFQRRINAISPTPDGRARLAKLLLQTGEIDEAEALWARMADMTSEPHRVLKSIDSLMAASRYEVAQQLCEKLVRKEPRNWEALYRLAVIDWKQDKKDAAAERFAALFKMDVELTDESAAAKYQRAKAPKNQQAAAQQRYIDMFSKTPMQFGNAMYSVQQLLRPDPNTYYGNRQVWSPTYFGEARVAALIASMIHNGQDTGDKGEEFFQQMLKKAKETVKTDPQPSWDAYYVAGFMANSNGNQTRTFEIAQVLVQRPEPYAKVLFLASLGQRHVLNWNNQGTKNIPPLSDEQIETMLSAWEAVSNDESAAAMRGMYGGANSVQVVIQELKRAKRDEKAKELFDKVMNARENPQMMAAAMQIASSEGNTKQVLELLDIQKEESKKKGVPAGGSHAHSGPVYYGPGMVYSGSHANYSYMYLQLAAKHAKKKEFDDILMLANRLIDERRDQFSEMTDLQRKRAARQSNSGNQQQMHVQIYNEDNRYEYRQIDFPMPDAYFDNQSITFLYNVFHHFQKADKLDDLFDNMKKRSAAAKPGIDQEYTEMVQSFLHWWNGDKKRGTEALVKLAQSRPNDFSLRLRLAKMYQEEGDSAAALALVDSVTPQDHNVLKNREIVALQLAVVNGNIERARKAAGRLFGLRLDNNTQIQLAAQMHQLGMHDMAEGVLARTRRRAGNQSSTLMALMQQYQSQGNVDVAVQIAHQILRRTKSTSSMNSSGVYRSSSSNQNSAARKTAMTVLARSGEIDNLIDRVNKQLERSPNSTRLHEILADYYRAAGKNDKAAEILSKVAKLKPDDPKSMLAMAKQFQNSGQTDEALDMYLKIIKKEPMLVLNDFYQYRRLFDNAKRMPDLADALLAADFSKMRNSYYNVLNVSENLLNKAETRDKGLELFKKAWDAFPDNRAYLIGNIDNAEVWKLPIMFDYARQGIIPQSAATASRNPWGGIGDSLTYYGSGKVEGTLTRLMRGLKEGDRMKTFRGEVEAALKEYPGWHGGELILAVIESKTGDAAASAKRIEKILADKDSGMTGRVAMVAAQEFKEAKGELLKTGIRMMEFALKNGDQHGHEEFEYSPGRTLVAMYANSGQRKKARDMMLDMLSNENYDRYGSNNPGYGEYQKIQNNLSAGKQMLELDFPVETMRLLSELTEGVFEASKRWGGSSDYYKKQVDALRKKAQKKITPEILVAVLEESLTLEEPEPSATQPKDSPDTSKDGKNPQKKTSPKRKRAVLDFGLQPPQGSLDALRMSAFLTDAFEQIKATEEAKTKIAKRIADLRAAQPDDPSLVLAAAMLDSADEDKLAEVVAFFKAAEASQEKPAADAKPDAAGYDIQSAQISAWLVAREALAESKTAAAGNELANLATAAARRESNKQWLMSILRERGALAAKAGAKDEAEKYWTEMLDLVLVKPKANPEEKKSNSFLDALKNRLLPSTKP